METLKKFIKNHKVTATILLILFAPIILPIFLLVILGVLVYGLVEDISKDW